MLKLLQFIFSSFWIWLGFTILVGYILKLFVDIVKAVYLCCFGGTKRYFLTEIIKNDILSDDTIDPQQKIVQINDLINFSRSLRYVDEKSLKEIAEKIMNGQ